MLADRGHVSGVYGAPGLRRFKRISRGGGAGHIVFLSRQLGATSGNCFTTVNEPSSERKPGTRKITTARTEGHPNDRLWSADGSGTDSGAGRLASGTR